MADRKLACPKCGHENVFSEYARGELKCRQCGEGLQADGVQTSVPAARRLSVRRKDEAQPEDDAPDEPVQDTDFKQITDHSATIRNKRKLRVTHHMLSWTLFVVLAAGAVYLRYGQALRPEHLAVLKRYSPHALAAIWVLITLRAFKDSVFAGIASFLCPPASLYYLFFQSGDFYGRAVVGGLLLAIAEDAAIFYYKWFLWAIDFVKEWIYYGALH